ncbi:glycosyltransferase domain-containing protein [Klebsiella variicola]|uniref:glycosyltransferase domain-containing protein n=1 Tax=Klebsiella variicola TaxID=244366 RepID=UPI002406CB1D|nr:glycosyltransferase domain-containing protein [Klebsiella variicola]MDG0343522.1 DUF616 domain-containing protein [Klebsiella variicola]
MSKEIVVYTAITGSYDSLSSVKEEEGIDYIVFTDQDFSGVIPKPWKHIRLPASRLNNKDLARFCKLNPHRLLPTYNKSLWLDGNIVIKSEIKKLILDTLKNDYIASYDHWWRDKTEQEFLECALLGHDFILKLRNQYSRYKKDGYSSYNFFENNVIFRQHMNENVVKMHDLWWGEYLHGGKRDQYSFTYASYKVGIVIKSMGLHDPRIVKRYFDYKKHSKNKPLKEKILMRVNRAIQFVYPWNVSEPQRENSLLK